MNAIRPLGFTGVEEEVEDDVQPQEPEYFGRPGRGEGEGSTEEQTGRGRRLYYRVQAEIIRIESREKGMPKALQNPGDVGK
jgi:hypothetical protein